MFEPCEICNQDNWQIIYKGKIRDGVYGTFKENTIVCECSGCGVQRLRESDCMPSEYYESGEYRKKLLQSLKINKAISEQDNVQKYMIESIGGLDVLRNKSIADVGCGAGSFLDMTVGIAQRQIGIEPCQPYFDLLKKRGYVVYPSLEYAKMEYAESLDWALSSQVIEHVVNPVDFIKEIYDLLKPGGQAMISTPNRNDILNSLLPEFREFFYRTQHRWYFDKDSIEYCAKKTGFEKIETKFIHRYGIANAIYWLRDKEPKGHERVQELTSLADHLWSGYLNEVGKSDNLFLYLQKM